MKAGQQNDDNQRGEREEVEREAGLEHLAMTEQPGVDETFVHDEARRERRMDVSGHALWRSERRRGWEAVRGEIVDIVISVVDLSERHEGHGFGDLVLAGSWQG